MNKFSELKDREGGFTLIELLVVIIIIGILAAIAIPLFLDQRKLAVDASVKSDVRNTVTNITTAQAVDSASNATTTNFTGTGTTGNTVELALYATAAPGALGTYTAVTAGNNATGRPVSGQDFVVRGYNAGGKVFVATGSAYKFDSKTGAFGQ